MILAGAMVRAEAAPPAAHDDAGEVFLDREICHRALRTRDARFDGRFYTAVRTTGVFCRPICPARVPKIENCIFLPSAAAAHRLGFRPCLRCRPEVAPGVAGWRGTANTVSRALSLLAEGALDDVGVDELAERLGVGARHLRRLFERHVGASPISVAQTHRILFAKKLIGETTLSMSEIALAAGFGSLRRFNDALRRTYGRPPTALRTSKAAAGSAKVALKLPFSPPYHWPAMLDFLRARAIPGVEAVSDDCYRRTFGLPDGEGVVEVRKVRGENHLLAVIQASDVRVLTTVVVRLRRLFDLDADAAAIDAHLARDRRLAKDVRERPGVRVPGAWDGFEVAVRAVLGQQVSVAAATTFAGRLVAAHGRSLTVPFGSPGSRDSLQRENGPSRLFPSPVVLAAAELTDLGVTRSRAATLRSLAGAVDQNPDLLVPRETLDETVTLLGRLPGIGDWTAQYVALRALGEPDAFPASDLGLLRALEAGGTRPKPAIAVRIAEAWRPWRAYAVIRLWTAV